MHPFAVLLNFGLVETADLLAHSPRWGRWSAISLLITLSLAFVYIHITFFSEVDLLKDVDALACEHAVRQHAQRYPEVHFAANITLLRAYLANGVAGLRCFERWPGRDEESAALRDVCMLSIYLPWYTMLAASYYRVVQHRGFRGADARWETGVLLHGVVSEELLEKAQIALPERDRGHMSSDRRVYRGSPYRRYEDERLVAGVALPFMVFFAAYARKDDTENITQTLLQETFARRDGEWLQLPSKQ